MTDTDTIRPGGTYQERLMLALWRAQMEGLPERLYHKFARQLNIIPDEIDNYYNTIKSFRSLRYGGTCPCCLLEALASAGYSDEVPEVDEQLLARVRAMFVEALDNCPTWCELEVGEWWTYLGIPGDTPHKVPIQVDFRAPGDGDTPDWVRQYTYYAYSTMVDNRELLAKLIANWLPAGAIMEGFKVQD